MASPWILEVDEERVPKERPPALDPIPSGSLGDAVVTHSKKTRFSVFGRSRAYAVRDVSRLSRIVKGEKDLFLPDPEDRLVKLEEDDPETVYRAWNYARLVRGRVLVLGLKLGLFPRLAVHARRTTIVSSDTAVNDLVWAPVAHKFLQVHLVWSNVEDFLRRTDEKFDFIYVDLGIARLMEANALIRLVRRILAKDGHVAVRSYGMMVQNYQARCQQLITSIALQGGPGEPAPEGAPREERLFIEWVGRNWERAFVRADYRFVNAWSRKTALEIVE